MNAMTPLHHPDPDLLLDYASGALSEAASAMIAAHLTYCPACRAEHARLEAVGGRLLEEEDTVPVHCSSHDLFERIFSEKPKAEPSALPALPVELQRLPRPLHPYIARSGNWRSVTRNLAERPLPADGGRLRLMRIRAGQAMPRHTHRGREMVMVLSGGFSDEMGTYERGDFSVTTDAHTHTPIAHAEQDCLCIALVEGHLRLTGVLGFVVNPFLKF
jgi:putative transcriptional regulator